MAVPDRADPDDPILKRVRALALSLPNAKEKRSVGYPAFYTDKVFLWYGMPAKIDGNWTHFPQSISVLLTEIEREAVLAQPGAYVPGYIGPSGWIGIDLSGGADWDEVAELIEESYRQTAPKRLVAQLDLNAD